MPSFALIYTDTDGYDDRIFELQAQRLESAMDEARLKFIGTSEDLDGDCDSADDVGDVCVWSNGEIILEPGSVHAPSNVYVVELAHPCPVGLWQEELGAMCTEKAGEILGETKRREMLIERARTQGEPGGFSDWVRKEYPKMVDKFIAATAIAEDENDVSVSR